MSIGPVLRAHDSETLAFIDQILVSSANVLVSIDETTGAAPVAGPTGLPVVLALAALEPSATATRGDPLPANTAIRLRALPNPAMSDVDVESTLPETARTRIEVVDVRGRCVRVLADREEEAGLHAIDLDTASMASGIYFVRIASGGATAARRMVVLER